MEAGVRKALDIDVESNQRLLSIEKAAVYLDLSPRELYNMVSGGDLPAVKRGRRVLFDIRDLNAWIERNKTTNAMRAFKAA